jgi:hypothetical protein
VVARQEAPPIFDIFKNMQDGFDNVAENSIIRMNRADVKLLATTVADILVTYGWCVPESHLYFEWCAQ